MSTSRGDKTINYHNGDVYKGEIDIEGRPHGKGTYTHHVKPGEIQQGRYDGDWIANKKHGKGIHYYRNGDVYDGPWENGERDGLNGKYTYYKKKSKEYTGDWKNNEKHGHGVMRFTNGDKYDGDWKNNFMEDDEATYTYKDRSTYVGKCSVSLDVSKWTEKLFEIEKRQI
jgi:hypothetical protein